MRMPSTLAGAMALVGVALMPTAAQAQCTFNYTFLGIGGALTGCVVGTASAVGEDAGDVSSLYWFDGMPGLTGPLFDPTNISVPKLNAPSAAATPHLLFDDNCGSAGNGAFSFACASGLKNFNVGITTPSELVFGLAVPDGAYGHGGYWVYSGGPTSRNGNPAPDGYQSVLLQVVQPDGVTPIQGQFVLGFEDLNTGCYQANPAATSITIAELGNGSYLDSVLNSCSAHNGGGTASNGGDSDADYNDFYISLSLTGTPASVVPEPVTMSLMAMGLIGLGATSLRRRTKQV